ncbi:MAG TPA: class I SAM-dependent methyltransferase [Urbifossiella sp.]|jgi:tRNA (mo5U34)-methyltransferase|nr:class I SAM-dependent methyltransferase [Urbifossiella sp.]
MDRAGTQARIDAIDWYHEFDFGNGLRAVTRSDVEGHRTIWGFIERQLDAIDFRGKTVLDIGCWDGYWSFYAERRGAKAVLAVDDFSQNWASASGIYLARDLLRSNVEVEPRQSIYDLSRLGRTFDIVLCLGVFYHLWDPYHAFAQIRHCCHPGTVVAAEGNATYGLPPHGVLYSSAFHTSRFTPTCEALAEMLTAAYLRPSPPVLLHPKPEPVAAAAPAAPTGRLGWRWRLRAAGAALRGSRAGFRSAAETLFPPEPPAPPPPPPKPDSRVFMTCAPIDGVNPVHPFRPPFGLHAYDPRYRDTPDRVAA